LNLFQIFLGESSVKICVNRLKLVFQVDPIELIFDEDLLLGVLNSSTKFQVCLKSFDWLLTFSPSWAETNWLRLICKLHRAYFLLVSNFACFGLRLHVVVVPLCPRVSLSWRVYSPQSFWCFKRLVGRCWYSGIRLPLPHSNRLARSLIISPYLSVS